MFLSAVALEVVLSDGPSEAFRREALGCLDALYAFALSLARDRTVAEDLVQETYLRAFAAKKKAEADESLRSWMFTILHNVWRNDQRRRRPVSLEETPQVVDRLVSAETDPFEALGREEDRDRVARAIEALPESFREVLLLRCVEEFSYRDLATILGCPAGTVMSRLARARVQLRRILARDVRRDGAA